MGAGGVGGNLTDAVYGSRGADSAQGAAMAQQNTAKQSYNTYKDQIGTATVAGLTSLDKDIANQQANLDRQTKLISNLDPTIIEASQQALKLLRGESSSTLAPVQAQRDQQRQKLVNSLREQLGPGAETSTAGIQALTKFDSETNQLISGQQQQALQTLGGVSQQFSAQRPDMLREVMGLSNFGQQQYGLRSSQAQGLFSASQPLIQSAGAQYTGDMLRYQQNASRTSAWADSSLKFGESFGGMGMGSMGGGGGGGSNAPQGNGTGDQFVGNGPRSSYGNK